MCGIAGFSGNFDLPLLEQMNQTIAHRGPDDEGVYLSEKHGIGLAHRRLSIIDLSAHGHQPMWDITKTVAIVFNGEIFNYQELRNNLIEEGWEFESHCDTEVLLNLYLKEGADMLNSLNGMFAFALWDTRSETLFLARDGVGVKPLYYAQTPKGFLFASELKALLQESSLDKTLNPEAIHYYLSYLWCPAPHTILQSVQKLKPGHALFIKNGKIEKSWSFYDLPYHQPIEHLSEKDAIEQVQQAVKQAVERQMVADVPVGAFLSGGLDSSAVVAFAREYSPQNQFDCFTIGFKDSSFQQEGMADDLPFAQRVAKYLDVNLHTIYVGTEMLDQLETMIYHLDEPQADPAPLNALFISKLAHEQGLKVLLSGAGGDDIFTGYRRHYALMQEQYWKWLPASAREVIQHIANKVPASHALGRRFSKAFRFAGLNGDANIASYFHWLDPHLQHSLYGPLLRESLKSIPFSAPLLSSLDQLTEEIPDLNRMLYLEGKHFLADHNLNYTDKMSMATGIEVRVPLLDPDLIDLTARLPVDFKQRGNIGKWIFKKAMESYLPHDVIYRPKTGFGVPLRHWLRNELSPVVADILSETSLKNRGLFDFTGVQRLVQMDQAGKIDGTYTIFSLICIELWCRIFLDQAGKAFSNSSAKMIL